MVLTRSHCGGQNYQICIFEARELLDSAGVRVSSIQWPGGFTGSEGQTFQESFEDAYEAIDIAEQLHCPFVVLRTGARAGIRSHARRLIQLALAELAPAAEAVEQSCYKGNTGQASF